MRAFASAPSKVILFGEHAVVYGYPALVCAVDARVSVEIEEVGVERGIEISSDKVGELRVKDPSSRTHHGKFDYVLKAIEIASREWMLKPRGLRIRIRSDVPIGAGMGSSASVSVATLAALAALFDLDVDRDEIAMLGHRVELEVQRGLASRTDTAIATFGGYLMIRGKDIEKLNVRKSLPLVIGNTGRERRTADLVRRVRELRERRGNLVDDVMKLIGDIVEESKRRLEIWDLEALGDLMNMNHGLLVSLGVSCLELEKLIYAALSSGALGAKLTGAGGGGCMIALAPGVEREVSKAIRDAGGDPIVAGVDTKGLVVRVEDS